MVLKFDLHELHRHMFNYIDFATAINLTYHASVNC